MKRNIITLISVIFLWEMSHAQSPSKVTIGYQVWMTENLSVDKFRNGEIIPEAGSDTELLTYCYNQQPWCKRYKEKNPEKVS
jgi:hypothetical protein